MLANFVARRLDAEIQSIATQHGATYTRYADDMVLTLSNGSDITCTSVFREVASVVKRHGFRINRRKSRIVGPGGRKVVTGLVVNDLRPRLPKSVKSEIDLAIYHIGKHGLLSHMERHNSKRPLGYLNHLVGKILYAYSIEPAFAANAMAALREALTPNRELLEITETFESVGDAHKRFQLLYRNIFG
jgi:RNA-directed DNA polymerase